MLYKYVCHRDRPRFFEQVGHQTTSAYIENKPFFTKYSPRQTYQNYEQPCQRSQNSEFQSHYSESKIGRIFPKKNSVKNISLEDELILMIFLKKVTFKVLYLLKMCQIFVSSVHNFGKSDNDII